MLSAVGEGDRPGVLELLDESRFIDECLGGDGGRVEDE